MGPPPCSEKRAWKSFCMELSSFWEFYQHNSLKTIALAGAGKELAAVLAYQPALVLCLWARPLYLHSEWNEQKTLTFQRKGREVKQKIEASGKYVCRCVCVYVCVVSSRFIHVCMPSLVKCHLNSANNQAFPRCPLMDGSIKAEKPVFPPAAGQMPTRHLLTGPGISLNQAFILEAFVLISLSGSGQYSCSRSLLKNKTGPSIPVPRSEIANWSIALPVPTWGSSWNAGIYRQQIMNFVNFEDGLLPKFFHLL